MEGWTQTCPFMDTRTYFVCRRGSETCSSSSTKFRIIAQTNISEMKYNKEKTVKSSTYCLTEKFMEIGDVCQVVKCV